MEFVADLHVHSRFSRATARSCDLHHYALWARKKGVAVVATGDITHPAWRAELRRELIVAGDGVYALRPELDSAVRAALPGSCHGDVRFLLQVEISTIYKKGERTRKVHHVIYVPDLDAADRLAESLERIGNIRSDGRPILGLDSRDLLELVLECDERAYLVPAHVWTPWFAALGSKSGFDSIDDCYGDLAEHVFAAETGLSSDPPMNWRVGGLDRLRLVSNSDAHSPPVLARNACVFDGPADYEGIRNALRTGEGYVGTIEFFPEEGKYHLDGHRKCGVRLTPAETRALDGRCPVCDRPLTVGVMHRVEELADHPPGRRAPHAGEVRSLVPLPEILSEILGVGPKSKTVARAHESLLARLGPELSILHDLPLARIREAGSGLLAEGIERLRAGRVIREAGYDGEFGVVRLFGEGEIERATGGGLLFELPARKAGTKDGHGKRQTANGKRQTEHGKRNTENGQGSRSRPRSRSRTRVRSRSRSRETITRNDHETRSRPTTAADPLDSLDQDQRRAACIVEGPLLITAGPGSGKTRTLTHRIAHLVRDRGVAPGQCLAITFTRRAAEELRERLDALLDDGAGGEVAVHTFHGLGLAILREHAADAGLPADVRVADEAERLALAREVTGLGIRKAKALLAALSRFKRGAGDDPGEHADLFEDALAERGLLDFDDLVLHAAGLLAARPALRAAWRARYPYLSVDEFQDVDAAQYALVRQLAEADGHVCVIGDPDQAIYGFRGADVRLFARFAEDFPGAVEVRLTRNYRSGRAIVEAAGQVITGLGDDVDRRLDALLAGRERIVIHPAPTERAEAEYVVHTTERLIGGHSFFSMDSGRTTSAAGSDAGLTFADVAVLYRTDAQADALVEALARSGMPYQRRSHGPLGEQPGVAALLAALRDGSRTPSALVTDDDPAELRAAAALLAPLAARCGDDVARLQSEVALCTDADRWDPRAQRISLLTLHAAKGLEFRVVFVVGCEDGLLPLTFGGRPPTPDALAEERRLFYVGMTRARDRLYLCRAARRRLRGRATEPAPSPFLRDIEERLIEVQHTRARRGRRDEGQMDLFGGKGTPGG